MIEKEVKGVQEQAVASWINYLNQLRINELLRKLSIEGENLVNANNELAKALKQAGEFVENNRGGDKGLHGFIAEAAECGIGNARRAIEGKIPNLHLVDNNGPIDILQGAQAIQMKFVEGGGNLSLDAVAEHLNKYPDYVEKGGIYKIPSGYYEKIKYYLSIDEKIANKMPTSNGEFNLRQWKYVHKFFDEGKVPLNKIKPSKLGYDDVQREAYANTIKDEKKNLREKNEQRKAIVYEESKPTLKEGAKATLIAGAVEGGMTLLIEIAKKRKEKNSFSDFTEDDWVEIFKKSGIGFGKGSIRGASIYALTNFTATPAAVASALVSASFGMAEQINKFRKGELSEIQLITNSELLFLDAGVGALSALLGQMAIPIPILGAVIGNVIGTMMYKTAKDNFQENEQKVLKEWLTSLKEKEKSLDAKYQEFINNLNENMIKFMELLENAFAPDIRIAFKGSAELAVFVGVPYDDVLDSKEKIDSYFID